MNPVLAQRAEALNLANQIRLGWAAHRREIAALPHAEGCKRVAAMLISPPREMEPIRLDRVLRSIRWMGDVKVTKLIATAPQFNPSRRCRRIRELTTRERAALVLALRRRAA